MAGAKNKVDQVIKTGLHPHLRQAGYRKRGRTYRLEAGDVIQIVSVSRSVRELPDLGTVGHYGVELGVYFPDAYMIGQGRAEDNPSIHECYVFGGLPADGWGFFDDIAADQPNVEQQAQALEQSWLSHGEAWFTAHREPRAACQWAVQAEEWKEALYFAIYQKDWPQAEGFLEKCRASLGGQWLEYVEVIARRHGVPGARAD